MTDIHLKAVCNACLETVAQNDSNYPHFIEYIEKEVTEEPATDKQINYIKYLIYKVGEELSRVEAGDIIKTLVNYERQASE
jgi:hypothetical protein